MLKASLCEHLYVIYIFFFSFFLAAVVTACALSGRSCVAVKHASRVHVQNAARRQCYTQIEMAASEQEETVREALRASKQVGNILVV